MISQIFVLLLAINAGYVAYGLSRKKVMWKWIILYWVILTLKNLYEFMKW